SPWNDHFLVRHHSEAMPACIYCGSPTKLYIRRNPVLPRVTQPTLVYEKPVAPVRERRTRSSSCAATKTAYLLRLNREAQARDARDQSPDHSSTPWSTNTTRKGK